MKYVYLFFAILFELLGSSLLNKSDGFSKIFPTLMSMGCYVCSFYTMSLVLREMPLGIVYAIWSGIGIVATTLISIYIFKQSINMGEMVGIVLIVLGVVVMNLYGEKGN